VLVTECRKTHHDDGDSDIGDGQLSMASRCNPGVGPAVGGSHGEHRVLHMFRRREPDSNINSAMVNSFGVQGVFANLLRGLRPKAQVTHVDVEMRH